jgi:TonB-linked SusC/RagA family outer membrane protein
MVLILLATQAQAQDINVKGNVVGAEDKSPMPGVSVVVKGTTTGITTDLDGNFRLKIPASAKTLVFSFMGMETQEVAIAGKTTFEIELSSTTVGLDEVIVVGYGTQKKRDVTGAITSIDNKMIEKRQAVNVYDVLQGEAPGVLVVSNSGAPGDDNTIRIRGTSTFEGGVNPLYVVDGVPLSDISSINPNDIKSMEILKDAASAAIYGSRSANGVIIITTKTGEEGRAKVDVRYLQSYNMLSRKIPQANAFERKLFENRANIDLFTNANDSLGISTNASNDYQDVITQIGKRKQLDLSVSGGSQKLKYFTSLGFLDETGIVLNSFNKRLSGRINSDFQATDKLKFTSRVTYSYQNTNKINEGRVIQQAMQRPPQFILYYPDGTLAYDIGGRKNPIAEAYYRENDYKIFNIGIYQMLEYKFNKYLKLQADVNGNFALSRRNYFNSALLTTTTPQIADGGDETDFGRNIAGEAYLTYNREFKKKHSVSAVLGTIAEDWYDEAMNFKGSNYVTEDVNTMNAIQALDLAGTTTSGASHSMVGFFGRLSYSYKGKYLFNSNIRRDGSSRFVNQRWGLFPSASLGWRISDEKFMKWSKKYLKDAKLRASWGVTGNQNIGNYESLNLYTFGSFYYQGISGVNTSNSFGNPDLKWEQTTQTNLGADLTLLDGRLVVNADYYVKTTDGLLYSSLMPSELGYSTIKVNFGSIENKGYEINLTGYPIQKKDFTWQTSLNFSVNKNKIVSLAGGDYVSNSAWLVATGQPIGQFYGYKALGVYQYDESNAYTKDFTQRLNPYFQRDKDGNVMIQENGRPILKGYTYPDGKDFGWNAATNPIYQLKVGSAPFVGGDMIWDNVDHNGVIDDKDREVLGKGLPSWFGGWNNTVNYKRFTLSFSFYVNWGNQIYNNAKYVLTTYSTSNVTPQPYEIYNAWRFQGQITDVPTPQKGTVQNTSRELSSAFLEDGSFIRLRNLRFSYQLDNKIAKKFYVQGLTAYIYGNNLLTWTNYTGFDPEMGGGNVLNPGKDSGSYPRKREIGFGINLNF